MKLAFFLVVAILLVSAQSVTFEAESGVRTGGTFVDTSAAGFTGTGYVSGFYNDGDTLTIAVNAPSNGLYRLTLRYRTQFDGDKVTTVQVNGQAFVSYNLLFTSTWKEVELGEVVLNMGSNTVTFIKNWGYYLIDNVQVEPSSRPPSSASAPPVDSKATPEARALLLYLQSIYGKKTLAGQYDISLEGWMKTNIGKLPATFGFDFTDYSPTRVQYGATSNHTNEAIAWAQRGGIVNIQWHWNAPGNLTDSGDQPWWKGIYTTASSWSIETMVNDPPNGQWWTLMMRDIDAIAVQIKKISDAKIPFLWRPLHEAEGGWFWWGSKGPEPAKKLWKILYDRLTNYHNLHNMIWVWNSVSPDWYVGDDWCDVNSFDSYPTPDTDHGAVAGTFRKLEDLATTKKVVAMAENGAIPDPDNMAQSQARYAWFSTWNDNFISDGRINTLSFLKKVYNHEDVITFDELPDLKSFAQSLPSLISGGEESSTENVSQQSRTVSTTNQIISSSSTNSVTILFILLCLLYF